jgi:hypothetical protein
MSTRPKLTDALEHKILVWIRSGVYPQVAAEAEGIPHDVFDRWLALGRRRSPPASPRYRRFAENVRQAVAVGRMRAEIKALDKDAKFWLLSGPGKERPEYPGWTTARKAPPAGDERSINLFVDPEFAKLMEALLAALMPFPEARKAAALALEVKPPDGSPGS